MKINIIGKIRKGEKGEFYVPLVLGKGSMARIMEIKYSQNELDGNPQENPQNLTQLNPNWWVYKDICFQVYDYNPAFTSKEELALRIKHELLKKAKELERIKREVEAFENFEKIPAIKREKISDSIKLFVWQRDEGKCVKCGKKEKLEFDHMIPVAEGGSNTERNIQILCENCNREKSKKIG